MFDGILDPIFAPIMNLPEPWGLLVISFILTAIITLIYKYATDQKAMKAAKEEMKEMQADMKKFKDDKDKVMAMQKDMMKKNFGYMKHSFKAMIYTFLPVIFIFGWLRTYYTNLGNPDIFFGMGWFGTYFVFSIILSMGLRKLMKVY